MQRQSLARLVVPNASDAHTKMCIRWAPFRKRRTHERNGVVAARHNEETNETFNAVDYKVSTELIGIFMKADHLFGLIGCVYVLCMCEGKG